MMSELSLESLGISMESAEDQGTYDTPMICIPRGHFVNQSTAGPYKQVFQMRPRIQNQTTNPYNGRNSGTTGRTLVTLHQSESIELYIDNNDAQNARETFTNRQTFASEPTVPQQTRGSVINYPVERRGLECSERPIVSKALIYKVIVPSSSAPRNLETGDLGLQTISLTQANPYGIRQLNFKPSQPPGYNQRKAGYDQGHSMRSGEFGFPCDNYSTVNGLYLSNGSACESEHNQYGVGSLGSNQSVPQGVELSYSGCRRESTMLSIHHGGGITNTVPNDGIISGTWPSQYFMQRSEAVRTDYNREVIATNGLSTGGNIVPIVHHDVQMRPGQCLQRTEQLGTSYNREITMPDRTSNRGDIIRTVQSVNSTVQPRQNQYMPQRFEQLNANYNNESTMPGNTGTKGSTDRTVQSHVSTILNRMDQFVPQDAELGSTNCELTNHMGIELNRLMMGSGTRQLRVALSHPTSYKTFKEGEKVQNADCSGFNNGYGTKDQNTTSQMDTNNLGNRTTNGGEMPQYAGRSVNQANENQSQFTLPDDGGCLGPPPNVTVCRDGFVMGRGQEDQNPRAGNRTGFTKPFVPRILQKNKRRGVSQQFVEQVPVLSGRQPAVGAVDRTSTMPAKAAREQTPITQQDSGAPKVRKRKKKTKEQVSNEEVENIVVEVDLPLDIFDGNGEECEAEEADIVEVDPDDLTIHDMEELYPDSPSVGNQGELVGGYQLSYNPPCSSTPTFNSTENKASTLETGTEEESGSILRKCLASSEISSSDVSCTRVSETLDEKYSEYSHLIKDCCILLVRCDSNMNGDREKIGAKSGPVVPGKDSVKMQSGSQLKEGVVDDILVDHLVCDGLKAVEVAKVSFWSMDCEEPRKDIAQKEKESTVNEGSQSGHPRNSSNGALGNGGHLPIRGTPQKVKEHDNVKVVRFLETAEDDGISPPRDCGADLSPVAETGAEFGKLLQSKSTDDVSAREQCRSTDGSVDRQSVQTLVDVEGEDEVLPNDRMEEMDTGLVATTNDIQSDCVSSNKDVGVEGPMVDTQTDGRTFAKSLQRPIKKVKKVRKVKTKLKLFAFWETPNEDRSLVKKHPSTPCGSTPRCPPSPPRSSTSSPPSTPPPSTPPHSLTPPRSSTPDLPSSLLSMNDVSLKLIKYDSQVKSTHKPEVYNTVALRDCEKTPVKCKAEPVPRLRNLLLQPSIVLEKCDGDLHKAIVPTWKGSNVIIQKPKGSSVTPSKCSTDIVTLVNSYTHKKSESSNHETDATSKPLNELKECFVLLERCDSLLSMAPDAKRQKIENVS